MSKLVYHDKLEGKEYIWECMLFSFYPISKPLYFILRITTKLYSFWFFPKWFLSAEVQDTFFSFVLGCQFPFTLDNNKSLKQFSRTHCFADQPLRNTGGGYQEYKVVWHPSSSSGSICFWAHLTNPCRGYNRPCNTRTVSLDLILNLHRATSLNGPWKTDITEKETTISLRKNKRSMNSNYDLRILLRGKSEK